MPTNYNDEFIKDFLNMEAEEEDQFICINCNIRKARRKPESVYCSRCLSLVTRRVESKVARVQCDLKKRPSAHCLFLRRALLSPKVVHEVLKENPRSTVRELVTKCLPEPQKTPEECTVSPEEEDSIMSE